MTRRTPLACRECGDTFDADPRLAVPCPTCSAPAGSPCKRPSEHQAPEPHGMRRRLAFELAPCSCLDQWEAAERAAGREPPPRMTAAEAWARFAPNLVPDPTTAVHRGSGPVAPPPPRPDAHRPAQLALL